MHNRIHPPHSSDSDAQLPVAGPTRRRQTRFFPNVNRALKIKRTLHVEAGERRRAYAFSGEMTNEYVYIL